MEAQRGGYNGGGDEASRSAVHRLSLNGSICSVSGRTGLLGGALVSVVFFVS